MSDTTPWYATREDVQRALDVEETARAERQIDGALASAVDRIDGQLHRQFFPVLATRTFDWPNYQYARAWRLWLEANELAGPPTLITNGSDGVLASDQYRLQPTEGPPYTSIEILLSGQSGWASGAGTFQGAVEISGPFGYADDSATAGTIVEGLDSSETDVDVSDGSLVGVGDLIRVDDERMVVTGRGWLDSGQNLGGAGLDAAKASVAATVADGSAFHAGETMLIEAERVLIEDVAGNTLVLRRAYAGSVLAAHANGVDLYVSRTLRVARGCVGTTAAAHNTASAVSRWVPPALVNELCIAEAMSTFEQKRSAYARTVGSGDSEREQRGTALNDIRHDAWTRFARQARISAI